MKILFFNTDLEEILSLTIKFVHIEESKYPDGVTIMRNVSTEFEHYFKYPLWYNSSGIKIKVLTEKNDIYYNPQHFLISWGKYSHILYDVNIRQEKNRY